MGENEYASTNYLELWSGKNRQNATFAASLSNDLRRSWIPVDDWRDAKSCARKRKKEGEKQNHKHKLYRAFAPPVPFPISIHVILAV